MIILGLIVLDIPPITGNWFSILIAWNTKWTSNILGTLLKGKLCLIDLIRCLSYYISLSISVTCSLAHARLTLGNPGIYCINTWSGVNLISTCRVVIWKTRFKQYMYISFKALNIVVDFISYIWINGAKIILRLNEIKNGIPFTKNISAVINTSL